MTKGMPNTKQSVSVTTDHILEEPCEATSLTHGFEAERRGRPLRLGSLLYERLQVLGLPLEAGTGGRTKWNRTTKGLPKTHWLDAVCVGASTPSTLDIREVRPLFITANGYGSSQKCNVNTIGFPCSKPKGARKVKGFQTGDLVRALVTTGKKQGQYVGRVLVRASGSFDITTSSGRIQGIHHRFCTPVHLRDGYGYAEGTTYADSSTQSSK